LAKIGLVSSIADAALRIDLGRKGFAIIGKEREGRISYEKGIAQALAAFQEASNQRFADTADPETIILSEYTFISQELQFCDKTDKDSLSSLNLAIQRLDEAFLVLKIVEDKTIYKAVESAFAHKREFRFRGLPKDSYHVACGSLKTRLGNILKTPGLDLIEKSLLKQRFKNLSAGQSGYIEKQKQALQNNK
jgi:hypothetical protein